MLPGARRIVLTLQIAHRELWQARQHVSEMRHFLRDALDPAAMVDVALRDAGQHRARDIPRIDAGMQRARQRFGLLERALGGETVPPLKGSTECSR
jgi:hypothetical protein